MKRETGHLRVTPYFSPEALISTFIITCTNRCGSVIVDPVPVDRSFYELLIARGLNVEAVMITTPQEYMCRPLITLGKIFPFQLICGETDLFPAPAVRLNVFEEEHFQCAGLTVQTIPVPSHSRASFMFRLESVVFSGSIVHAGTLGDTPNEYTEDLLVATVQDHLFNHGAVAPQDPENLILLPSMGPPSTIPAEQHLNPLYRDCDTPGG